MSRIRSAVIKRLAEKHALPLVVAAQRYCALPTEEKTKLLTAEVARQASANASNRKDN